MEKKTLTQKETGGPSFPLSKTAGLFYPGLHCDGGSHRGGNAVSAHPDGRGHRLVSWGRDRWILRGDSPDSALRCGGGAAHRSGPVGHEYLQQPDHLPCDQRHPQPGHDKIEILPLKYVDGHSYGDVVSRVIADVDQFADGLLMGFTQFFTGVITILGTIGFMFSIHGWIALLVICLTPISLFVARFIASHTYSMFRLQSETRGEETSSD